MVELKGLTGYLGRLRLLVYYRGHLIFTVKVENVPNFGYNGTHFSSAILHLSLHVNYALRSQVMLHWFRLHALALALISILYPRSR